MHNAYFIIQSEGKRENPRKGDDDKLWIVWLEPIAVTASWASGLGSGALEASSAFGWVLIREE